MRTRVESIDETVARLTENIEEAGVRAQQAQAEFETVQSRVGELDAGEVGLDDHHDRTVTALRLADERVAELQSGERSAERQVASLRARIDALSVGLDRKDGAAWLQRNLTGAGLFGSLANLVKVRPGYEAAIAAVLGAAADAVAAENFGAARSAVAALKASDGGRAAIVLGDWPAEAPAPSGPPPEGAVWATDLVDMPLRLRGALTAMLSGVAVVRDLSAALDLVAARPQLRAVTADGDLVGAGWVSGGSDRKPSTLEITSEVEKARDELAAAEKQAGELSAALSGALAEQKARQDAAEQALAALNESDAAISAIYEQLGRLGQDARTADDEWQRLIRQRDELETGRVQTVEELAALEQRLHNAEQAPLFDAAPAERQATVAAAEAARAAEVEARLSVRTAEERANAVRGRADSLRRAAAAEREARLRAQRAREAREHAAAVAAAVAESGRGLAQRLHATVGVASRRRDALAAERHQRIEALAKVREQVTEFSTKIAAVTEALHRDEVAKAQAALRIEQLEQQVLDQFGMATADLIAEYGPDVPLPPSELEMAEYEQARERGEQVTAPAPMPFDRPTQERRAKKCRTRTQRARPGQPVGAGGVRRARGALQLPVHPARGRQGCPQGSARRHRRRRHPHPAGVHRGLRRRGTRVPASVFGVVPRRRGQAAAHRSQRHADHRHRGRGAPARQEDQAAVAAVRRREVTDRGRDAGGDLPGEAVAVLRDGRGGGRARRRQPASPARAVRAAAGAVRS